MSAQEEKADDQPEDPPRPPLEAVLAVTFENGDMVHKLVECPSDRSKVVKVRIAGHFSKG